MTSQKANINPALLTFSRERIGYDISTIAGKLRVKEESWVQWENGEKKPTLNQLVSIAKLLDRTPAFFYLNQLPEEEKPLSEFRTVNNKELEKGSPKLIKVIREAKRNRMTMIELYENQHKKPTRIPDMNSFTGTIQEQAKQIREWLGVSMDTQKSWISSSQALTNWKNLIEEKDIYVVQFPFVEVEECRGFAIAEEKIPVIGINPKDSYNARIFTLIHELAHVLYRESILINDSLVDYFTSGKSLEQICNRLAAETLVPKCSLESEFNADKNRFREIKRLSRRFRVSGYVMLIRLKTEGLISNKEYRDLKPEFSFYDVSGKGSDSGDPYFNQIVRKGKLYLRTAFQSYFDNQINVVELANLTGWKVPNLNKLAAKTFGWPKEGRYV